MTHQSRFNPPFTKNESFDMDFMMPPDVMSIDSDISKFASC